ncbi:PQQ-dependent sugar dehydrogenase [Paremcibacter congregatus]|uniref:Sorbosone dehydrogenase n=1 Tax=Paremcibacter congregatus TaxID=2043170 RepID=A0A2G4YVQ1_9PROT|nr:PQQ-dependent sugar dehydrogenase [Paremcibacter congregatus]PHZ86424.1 sorbosone dehydrogenase [Paremcibacter congregatus]QDE28480.1 sorbosone dehydrogenase family protein [Paremcibacter congregatus]
MIRTTFAFILCFGLFGGASHAADLPLDKLRLPPGFSISIYAEVDNARQMAMGKDGTVYVGSRRAGKVYALLNPGHAPAAQQVVVLDQGLSMPSGVAYRDGDLYVADIDRLYRYPAIARTLDNSPRRELATDQFPDKTHHGWKFIKFGPDGKLYVPVGAPCNICLSDDPIFATITRLDVSAAQPAPEIYVKGVRNSVGFDWHPGTGDLWFTDNGGDGLGDEVPADELNHVIRKNQHFGYPYIHQGDIRDRKFGQDKNPADYQEPAQKLGAHVAALGMSFYTGDMFPAAYHNQIIIPEHGSWNRSTRAGHVGYRLTMVTLDAAGKAVQYTPFITGWLDEATNKSWGRPAATLVMPDGSLLISDDKAGVVYRVTYQAPE